MSGLSRRRLLGLGAGMLAVGACGSIQVGSRASTTPGLHELASRKGLRFGAAMNAGQLRDPRYVAVIRRECGVIVAENEHKMYSIRPAPEVTDFAPGDALKAFAETNDLAMRGHALLWQHPRWLPEWVRNSRFSSAAEAEAMLGGYIELVAGRYHPFLYAWDVVNEAVDEQTGELRETPFSRVMGVDVLDFCFHKARETAPGAKLAYNDYMSWESGSENHRTGVLKLLEELLGRGAPVDALGIQSHSNREMPNQYSADKQRAWRHFCDAVAGMGLEIYLTEFDVNDTYLEADITTRDRLIASYAGDYLDLMLSYPQVKELLAWGMVDKYSWLQTFLPREDGLEKRPTLYDSDYRPKPLREAVAAALSAAPPRPPAAIQT